MNVSERIQELRKQKGVSQEELANELGISRQAVSKWESGQSFPELDNIIALSDYFGVSADHILKGTDTPQVTKTQTPIPPKHRSPTELMRLYIERKNNENETEEKEILFQLAMTQKQKSILAMAILICSAVISVIGAFILGSCFNGGDSDSWIGSLYVLLIGFAMYHIGSRLSAKEPPFTVKYINRASLAYALVFLAAIHSVFRYMEYQYWYRTEFAIIYIFAAAIVYGIIMLSKKLKKLEAEMYPENNHK